MQITNYTRLKIKISWGFLLLFAETRKIIYKKRAVYPIDMADDMIGLVNALHSLLNIRY